MTLDVTRLVVDFGFLVLIWTVQLVIYPSFNYYTKENLFKWHTSYTVRVTFIVFPIMLSQLILALIQVFQLINWYTITSLLIIAALWLLTFLIFVPLHQSIDANTPVKNVCDILVRKNWIRTILWTSLFLISLLHIL
jgi:hypothetical protein